MKVLSIPPAGTTALTVSGLETQGEAAASDEATQCPHENHGTCDQMKHKVEVSSGISKLPDAFYRSTAVHAEGVVRQHRTPTVRAELTCNLHDGGLLRFCLELSLWGT